MKTVIEVLDSMLALHSASGTWTREGIAKDAAGRQVPADSHKAGAWSVEGALKRVIGDLERGSLLSDVCDACGVDLAAFNDAVRHQSVVVVVLRMGQKHVAA